MAQSQFLLLLAALVVVGIAIVLGTTAFVTGFTKSNFDNLLNESMYIATQAQSWKSTPEVLGGSPDQKKKDELDYEEISFGVLGMQTVPGAIQCYQNQDGLYALEPTEEGLWITGVSLVYENRVTVRVFGRTENGITTQGEADGERTVIRGGVPVFYTVESGKDYDLVVPEPCDGYVDV